MKSLIVLAASLLTALAAATPAEAHDNCYDGGYRGHRPGGYGYGYGYAGPRYCAPRPACPPPVYYAPCYCAPRPVCPPPSCGYGYGYAVPSIRFSFGYAGRPGYRW